MTDSINSININDPRHGSVILYSVAKISPLCIVLTSSSAAALNRDPYCPSVGTSFIASATAGNRGYLLLNTTPQCVVWDWSELASMWHVKTVLEKISVCLAVAHTTATVFRINEGRCPGRQLIPSWRGSTPMPSRPHACMLCS